MANDLRSWAARQRAPFTIFLVVSLAASALYWWITRTASIETLMLGPDLDHRPWSVVTYPWAYMPFGNFLSLTCFFFLLFWLLTSGPMLEREMGTPRFAAFWFVTTIVPGLLVAFGARALGLSYFLGGPWLPESAVAVLWCARNRSATILLYGMIPMSATWLAAFTAIADVLYFGTVHPVVGFLAGLHLIPTWFFGLGRLPLPYAPRTTAGGARKPKEEPVVKGGTKYDDGYYENVKKREIEREEQERLRKLFEGK